MSMLCQGSMPVGGAKEHPGKYRSRCVTRSRTRLVVLAPLGVRVPALARLVAELDGALAQFVAEALERRARHLVGYLCVDLHGNRDLGMAENRHRHPRMHVQGRQQRRARVPGVVDADAPDACFDASAIEAAVEVSRIAIGAKRCSENQVIGGKTARR